MNIKMTLYFPEEMRAYAVFLNTVAEALEARRKENGDKLPGLGGIDRASDVMWRDRAEVGSGEKTVGLTVTSAVGDVHPEIRKAFLGEQGMGASIGLVRKRGEPSPGHKRRTKAEIAEDEAMDKAEAQATQTLTGAIREPAAISTGGERVAPDDEPEVEQQDVADEADETAKAGAELSHENLRDSLGKYVQKYGMDAAQLDGPKLFALVFKNPAITKISAVPGDQASLKAALDGINEMLAKNPFDRAPVT